MDYKKHLIGDNNTIRKALELMSKVGIETILFAINERFDIVEDSFIENMDYSGILNEVNMIKIN